MKELKEFWEVENKIEALKVAIKVNFFWNIKNYYWYKACKLLSDNEDPDFYVIKFVHVMDIVETAG